MFQPQKEQPTLEQMLAKKQAESEQPSEHIKESTEEKALKPYQFLMVNVLREYLALELNVQTAFPFDVERVYDDFGGALDCLASIQHKQLYRGSLVRPSHFKVLPGRLKGKE